MAPISEEAESTQVLKAKLIQAAFNWSLSPGDSIHSWSSYFPD